MLGNESWVYYKLIDFGLGLRPLWLDFNSLLTFFINTQVHNFASFPAPIIPKVHGITHLDLEIDFAPTLFKLELLDSSIVVLDCLIICFFF